MSAPGAPRRQPRGRFQGCAAWALGVLSVHSGHLPTCGGSRPRSSVEGASEGAAAAEAEAREAHAIRLHRFDHGGLAAMLEAEARWERGEGPWPEAGAAPQLVQVSARQLRELEAHHAESSSLAQIGARTVSSAASAASATSAASAASVAEAAVQRHGALHASHGSAGRRSHIATRLSSLGSQYVGPIGVGSVLRPANCRLTSGKSLRYVPRDRPQEAAGLIADAAGSTDDECHAEEQAQVWVVFDTGSTNLWVASDACQTGNCARPGRTRYDHKLSQTYRAPRSRALLQVEFGTGTVSGPQAVDDFHVGPFTVYNQTFCMIASQEGAIFDKVPFEGILGLAFPTMSDTGVIPFFDQIIQQKALAKNQFAFYFSVDDPAANAIFWGGADSRFHVGPIEYFEVVDPSYWSVALQSFQIGGEELLGGGQEAAEVKLGGTFSWRGRPKAIIDTGTTFFTAETAIYQEIMARIPPGRCDEMTEETHPPILFQLRNAAGRLSDFRFDRFQYMAGDGLGRCLPAFMRIDLPWRRGPAMILGEVFLRRYFSVFDRGDGRGADARVGLARAAHGEQVHSHLRALTKGQPSFVDSHESGRGRR